MVCEWCLRTDTGTLYFWPPEESWPFDVTVPVIETLIELRGTAESPLRHLTISGLTFTQTRTPFPEHAHENFHAPTKRGAGIALEHCDGCCIEGNRFVRNIVSYAAPNAMLLAASSTTRKAVAECDYNVCFLAANQEPQIRGVGSLNDWKKLGFDRHSLVADPQFVDVEHGDYRLRPESPAFSLGFQPIPMDRVGPRSKKPSHDPRRAP